MKAIKIKKPTLQIAISAFNEEPTIEYLLTKILNQKQSNFKLKEILVVSDGSTDKTVQIIEAMAKKHPVIRLIDDPQNKGKLFRTNQIFRNAKYDMLVCFDADMGLTSRDTISRAVSMLQTDKGAQMISIHQVPVHTGAFMSKVIHASFCMWDSVRLSVPGYQSVHSFYDGGTLYRGAFARTLKIPAGAADSRVYQFIMADRLNHGFRLMTDMPMIYWPPVTLNEWKNMYKRAAGKPQPALNKLFKENVSERYHMPRKYVIEGTLKSLIKRPFYTFIAIVMGYVLNKQAIRAGAPKSATWEISTNSKLPIPV